MHALVFVLHNTSETTREIIEAEDVQREVPLSEYVGEYELEDSHFTQLSTQIEAAFGKDNVDIDHGSRRVTIRKPGIYQYFNNLRARIFKTAQLAMDKPIEDFIRLRGETDWYAILTSIDDKFEDQFYLYGYGSGSMTIFAHNLYVQMGYQMTDTLTLELTQVFDFHY